MTNALNLRNLRNLWITIQNLSRRTGTGLAIGSPDRGRPSANKNAHVDREFFGQCPGIFQTDLPFATQ